MREVSQLPQASDFTCVPTDWWLRFQVPTAASKKTTVFWDTPPCSLVEVDRRFGGAYWLHRQDDVMMETVTAFETSGNFYETTLQSIPEDCRFADW
jgi:hypothetical protein